MRWDIDDSSKLFHLAFEATPDLVDELDGALDDSASPSHTGPNGEPRDLDSLSAFQSALVGFFERHRTGLERARRTATVRPTPDEVDNVRRALQHLPFERFGQPCPALPDGAAELQRLAWEEVLHLTLAQHVTASHGPPELVEFELDRLRRAVRALSVVLPESAFEPQTASASFVQEDGSIDHDNLLTACLDVCVGPFARSVGIGPCAAELVPEPQRTLLAWRDPSWGGSRTAIEGHVAWARAEELIRLAEEVRDVLDELSEADDAWDGPSSPAAVRARGLAFAEACEEIGARRGALVAFVVRSALV